MLVISIPGNALILWVTFKDTTLRTSVNLLVCNIALASLLIGILRIPFKILSLLHPNIHYPFSITMCQFQHLLPISGIMVISLSLTTICVNRYLAIVHPLKTYLKLSQIKVLVLVLCYWAVSIGCFIPYASFNTIYSFSHNSSNVCIPYYPETLEDIIVRDNSTGVPKIRTIELSRLINWTFFGLLTFVIPASIMMVLYSITIYTLWFSKVPLDQTTNVNVHLIRNRLRRHRKAIKLLFACFLAFIIFNTPYYTIFLLVDLQQLVLKDKVLQIILVNILIFLNYSSIAYNAVIYGYFNLSIRQSVFAVCKFSFRTASYSITSRRRTCTSTTEFQRTTIL